MFLIKVTETFEAAHVLPNYEGPCANVHGHRWKVTAAWHVQDKLNESGISVDLVLLKRILRELLKTRYDHHFLNDAMNKLAPSAENLAVTIYEQLARHQEIPAILACVTIEETEGCTVSYIETNYESI